MPASMQQPLDHLRLGLVAGEGDLDQLAATAASTAATVVAAVRAAATAVGAAAVGCWVYVTSSSTSAIFRSLSR